jgi:hypothetical protein
MKKGKSSSSSKVAKAKAAASAIASAMQQNPTPHGGDLLNPESAPQPGDPMTKLFANQNEDPNLG